MNFSLFIISNIFAISLARMNDTNKRFELDNIAFTDVS